MARWQISVLAAVVLLAGCGGDSGSSASEDYANSVCSNLSTWVTDLQGVATSLQDAGASIDKSDPNADDCSSLSDQLDAAGS